VQESEEHASLEEVRSIQLRRSDLEAWHNEPFFEDDVSVTCEEAVSVTCEEYECWGWQLSAAVLQQGPAGSHLQ